MSDDNPWIQTYCGKIVDLLDPDPGSISIFDIAHALSLINRFTGHTVEPYNVAQHSVLCSRQVPLDDPRLALIVLMHDAHEAYVGDVSSPVKRAMRQHTERPGPYDVLENRFKSAVRQALNLPYATSTDERIVSEIDLRMCVTECRDLLGPQAKPWGIPFPPYDFIIEPWDSGFSTREFLRAYYELRSKIA